MFTSFAIMFALLSFLAGANACIECPARVKVDGSTSHLHETFPTDQFTYCSYDNVHLIGDDSSVGCAYDNETGKLSLGYQSCPATATVKNNC
ncbi:uncharacterized protein EDB91DRAFT_1173650 [Suillus paluster]|uniref:uncharacterized protein n=1 Tax=Suillus paluster TaxID=48578 RepID=UPI001B8819BC|nr:uncharacterized protein EDB91DRAFT_1173650 [Suillus paluster]KAG1723079.1 hypothetical protein EDB91DRAFT_1173650 [Suillus paluster]